MITLTRELAIMPEYPVRSICPVEEMLLFDIETTGLHKETTQLYLIGCAYSEKGHWFIRQWLTSCAADEYEVLEAFLEFASHFRVLVHFNGNRFDIPYLNYKCGYYMTRRNLSGHLSFDLYTHARAVHKLLGLKSLSQKSLETFLGINREDQMDGGLLIPVYYDYEKTGDKNKERLLLLHNYDDLQGMLRIMPVLGYKDLYNGLFTFVKTEKTESSLAIFYHLQQSVPVPVSMSVQPDQRSARLVQIQAKSDILKIRMPLTKGTGFMPLAPVSDYYYLPEEDIVIHKDVACFLERSRKIKASTRNCFIKKQDVFFFQPLTEWIAQFGLEDPKNTVYSSYQDLCSEIEKAPESAGDKLRELALFLLELPDT